MRAGVRSSLAAPQAGRLSSAAQSAARRDMATRPDTVGRNLDLESAAGRGDGALRETPIPASRAQYERAKQSLPGGNTRTGMFYTPFPLAIEKAAGATLTDVDGHTYTDFVGDFSAGLYGPLASGDPRGPDARPSTTAWPTARRAPTRSGWRRSSARDSPPSSRCASQTPAPRPIPWRWSPPARSAARTWSWCSRAPITAAPFTSAARARRSTCPSPSSSRHTTNRRKRRA